MDFALTPEQTELQDGTLQFARDRLGVVWCERDDDEFPHAAWKECGEFGLLGLLIPEEYGGSARDCLTAAVMLEALGYGCVDHGLAHAMVTQIICGVQLSAFGTESQKKNYLPGLASGELIASQAMTEPDAGSDLGALRTRAESNGDRYLITGNKVFITNGPIADVVFIFAVTAPDRPTLERLSCFIVDRRTSAFERSSPDRKLGLHTMKTGSLFFDACSVEADCLLGREGAGASLFSEAMEWERILLFSAQVGKMRRVLESTVEYANTRVQSAQSIGHFQSISHRIARARINLELGRLIVYRAAWLKATGKRAPLDASIAKYFVSESCKAACLDAVQIHGGYGYMEEFDTARELRDSIGGTIYSGTSEIQLNLIARLSGLS